MEKTWPSKGGRGTVLTSSSDGDVPTKTFGSFRRVSGFRREGLQTLVVLRFRFGSGFFATGLFYGNGVGPNGQSGFLRGGAAGGSGRRDLSGG